MSPRWYEEKVQDNRQRPLSVWVLEDLEVCLNANLGSEGGWRWELTERGKRLALYPSREDAIEAAESRMGIGQLRLL